MTSPGASRKRLLLAFPVVLSALIAAYLWTRETSLPERLAEDHRHYVEGEAFLHMSTEDPEMLRDFFRHRGAPYEIAIPDLGGRASLAGGRVHHLDGTFTLTIVYRLPSGAPLLCSIFPGRLESDAWDGETRLFRSRGVAVAIWREGPVVFALSAETDTGDLRELADRARSR